MKHVQRAIVWDVGENAWLRRKLHSLKLFFQGKRTYNPIQEAKLLSRSREPDRFTTG